MLNEKEILKYAMLGIKVEIEQLEKDIKQGYKYIEQIERGEKVKTPKTKQEILDIVADKKAKMEQLDKQRFEISWKLDMED